jgi:photosystem II Psb27 protein
MAGLLRRISVWADTWLAAPRLPLARGVLRSLVVVGLCIVLGLTACSSDTTGLSGNYVDDTVSVARSLLSTISLEQEDPTRPGAEKEARALINGYTARYRPRPDVNGLGSFTTMQTALNSLAAHYTAYTNRPLPEALRLRLEKEFKQAENGALRGA